MKTHFRITQNQKIALQYILLFIVIVFFMPKSNDTGFDLICWVTWANFIQANGLEKIYKFDVDYLPLYHYVLFIYGKIFDSSELVAKNIMFIKYIILLADFLGVIFVYRLIKSKYTTPQYAFFATLFILLNISYLYNNIFYGQVDALFTNMSFLSLFFALKKKKSMSIIFLVLALNFKLQAIVFVPFLALILLPQFYNNWSFKTIIMTLLPSIIIQFLILLPFIYSGDIGKLFFVVKNSMGKYPLVSMGAHNFWNFVMDTPSNVHDKNGGLFGRSYNKLGLAMFAISYAALMFPLFKFNYMIIKNKVATISVDKLLLSGGIIAIVFFFFNTQMHARYVHPSMIFLGAYALFAKRPIPFILFSLAYFFNIEQSMKVLKQNFQEYTVFVFNPLFISSLYLILIGVLFYELFFVKSSVEKYKISIN